jgi:hypothetical protein
MGKGTEGKQYWSTVEKERSACWRKRSRIQRDIVWMLNVPGEPDSGEGRINRQMQNRINEGI